MNDVKHLRGIMNYKGKGMHNVKYFREIMKYHEKVMYPYITWLLANFEINSRDEENLNLYFTS